MSEQKQDEGWSASERAGLRNLLRMAGFIFLALIIAGTIAAFLSLILGTL